MAERIYQCCYTNLTQEIGGEYRSGWQTVAVSQDIPIEAYKKCEQLQQANSTIQGSMTDEDGKILNLLEIVGDDKFVYVMRTQYGLQDRLGRRNMFSHAYILWWDDVIRDPNIFLQIAGEANFKADRDAALQMLDQRPESAGAYHSIEKAMEAAKLSAGSYPTLIGCVYAKMTNRRMQEPLYIQCGSEEQMRALLYCIYYGLPYYLRKKLRAASSVGNSAENKQIVFSRTADRQRLRFDPVTGDTTALPDRLNQKITRYGFIDYMARNTANTDYWERLKNEAVILGDPSASDELILKIAHKRLTSPDIARYSGSELDELLSDALRSNACGSAEMCGYIAQLLDRAQVKMRRLTDETRSCLPNWEAVSVLSKTQQDELRQLKETFNSGLEIRQAEIQDQLEAKYNERLADYAKKQADVEAKALEQRLKSLATEAPALRNSRIVQEYEREAEDQRKKREDQQKDVQQVALDFVNTLYALDFKEAQRENNKELIAELSKEKRDEYVSERERLSDRLNKRLDARLKRIRRWVEDRVGREQEVREEQCRQDMERKSKEALAEALGQKRVELSQQKQEELAWAYDKLAQEMESEKPPRLKELEAKENLARALKECNLNFVKTFSSDDALQKLRKLQGDRLTQYISMLSEVEGGERVLSDYFNGLLQKQPVTWETLHHVLAVSCSAKKRPAGLTKKLNDLAWDMYCQSLEQANGKVPSDYDTYLKFLAGFLTPESVEEHTKKAKEEFWNQMSFAHFSMNAISEYEEMRIETSKKCRMFFSFLAIVRDLPEADGKEEEILEQIQALFSRFRMEIGSDEERETALMLLEEAVQERYVGGDLLLGEWIRVFVLADSEQMCNSFLAVRSALYEDRYADLRREYYKLLKSKTKRLEELKTAICDIILTDCDRWDSSENSVPLDAWLLVAGEDISKSFNIFDRKKPAILQCSSREVVSSSALLKDPRYVDAATGYVQRRGSEFKTVKKWLNEMKQPIKRWG